jgi:hypothetical protein
MNALKFPRLSRNVGWTQNCRTVPFVNLILNSGLLGASEQSFGAKQQGAFSIFAHISLLLGTGARFSRSGDGRIFWNSWMQHAL